MFDAIKKYVETVEGNPRDIKQQIDAIDTVADLKMLKEDIAKQVDDLHLRMQNAARDLATRIGKHPSPIDSNDLINIAVGVTLGYKLPMLMGIANPSTWLSIKYALKGLKLAGLFTCLKNLRRDRNWHAQERQDLIYQALKEGLKLQLNDYDKFGQRVQENIRAKEWLQKIQGENRGAQSGLRRRAVGLNNN